VIRWVFSPDLNWYRLIHTERRLLLQDSLLSVHVFYWFSFMFEMKCVEFDLYVVSCFNLRGEMNGTAFVQHTSLTDFFIKTMSSYETSAIIFLIGKHCGIWKICNLRLLSSFSEFRSFPVYGSCTE